MQQRQATIWQLLASFGFRPSQGFVLRDFLGTRGGGKQRIKLDDARPADRF